MESFIAACYQVLAVDVRNSYGPALSSSADSLTLPRIVATSSTQAASFSLCKVAIGVPSVRTTCWQVFLDLDFTLMEMNPFTLDPKGMPFPLDMRGELDDTAAFKSGKKWGDLEFPLPFGRTMTSAEKHVHTLDSNTGRHPLPYATIPQVALDLVTM